MRFHMQQFLHDSVDTGIRVFQSGETSFLFESEQYLLIKYPIDMRIVKSL